ncbi:MAG TPA: heme-binding protein [Allosphingosinicella sp.]|jgi:hypothetical protein
MSDTSNDQEKLLNNPRIQELLRPTVALQRGAQIELAPGFHWDEVRAIPEERLRAALSFPAPVGPLDAFRGTFAGRGFNLIFRPNGTATPTHLPAPANGPSDNILELNLTEETLSFTQGTLGNIPNRGFGNQADLFLNGVPYVQAVNDVTQGTPVGIHFEPGVWLQVPASTIPPVGVTVVRMASIPHGTTVNLQGSSTSTAGPPNIPPVDPTPFFTANGAPFRFPSQTAGDPHTFRIPQDLGPFIASGQMTQALLDDPNSFLRNAIAHQNIVHTITIEVASAPEVPPVLSIPSQGGGNANIAFLTANANIPAHQAGAPPKMFAGAKSTFWIETVEHKITIPVFREGQPPLVVPTAPNPQLGIPAQSFLIHPPFPIPKPITITVHSTQIQYSQVVLLNFGPLSWPHVSVATLHSTTPIVPPSSIWKDVH